MNEHRLIEEIAHHVNSKNWKEIENYFSQSDFAKHLGISVSLDDPDKPRCEINDIKRFHLGGVGQNYINGAVLSAVFDFVIGLNGLGYTSLGNFATANVHIRFLKPVENDGFYAVSEINKKIGNRVFAEATLFNAKGEPCAHANGEIIVGIH